MVMSLINLCTYYDYDAFVRSVAISAPCGFLGQKPSDSALAARAGDIERSREWRFLHRPDFLSDKIIGSWTCQAFLGFGSAAMMTLIK